MCLSPQIIGNPSRRFTAGVSPRYLSVPCNSCPDCQSHQQDDWYVRAFFEYKRCKDSGGEVWFPTLTYNNEYLPVWNDRENNFSFPCFSYDDIKAFRNKMRVYLTRWFTDVYIRDYMKSTPDAVRPKRTSELYKSFRAAALERVQNIRFIICSEFGGSKGRPHYHALLFVPFPISFGVFKSILEKSWPNGFVMWSKSHQTNQAVGDKTNFLRPIIESSRGIKYVMKYISKDDSWFEKYGLLDYADFLKTNDSEKFKEFMRHRPRHFQSTYFGITGLDCFRDGDFFDFDAVKDGKISLMKYGALAPANGVEWSFDIPDYYQRKMMYDFDKKEQVYTLNDFGKDILRYRFNRNMSVTTDKLDSFLSSERSFIEHTFGVDIFAHCSKFSPLRMFQTKEQVYQAISTLLGSRNVGQLAIYSQCYRFTDVPEDKKELLRVKNSRELKMEKLADEVASGKHMKMLALGLDNPAERPFVRFDSVDAQLRYFCSADIVAQRLEERLSIGNFPLSDKNSAPKVVDKHFFDKKFTFGDFDCFAGFDMILTIIDEINSIVCLAEKRAKVEQKRRLDNIRYINSMSIYNHV